MALTGGIASGKTTVAKQFESLGVDVVDTDQLARDVIAPGSAGLKDIVATFGPEVLTNSGELDRAQMRRRVFADDESRRQLERITHPRIRDAVLRAAQGSRRSYFMVVIPLLYEHRHAYAWVHRTLVVDVSPQTQVDRLLKRDGIDLLLAQSMLRTQASRAERLSIADDRLDNESPDRTILEKRVASLHRQYLALAKQHLKSASLPSPALSGVT
ncbi:MAG: dephospho-CoA kinase [Xanthomonadales bacterium]|nr:dephospho-CoA kinase [Xanthomonadales bacterium]